MLTRRVYNRNEKFRNKIRTCLLIEVNDDLKSRKRSTSTRINSKLPCEIDDEFNNIVIELRQEFYRSPPVNKLLGTLNVNSKNELSSYNYVNEELDLKKNSIAFKKIKYFNQNVLKINENRGLYKEGRRSIFEENDGSKIRSNKTIRKVSEHKLECERVEKFFMAKLKNDKFHMAGNGFKFLQELSSKYKNNANDYSEYEPKRISLSNNVTLKTKRKYLKSSEHNNLEEKPFVRDPNKRHSVSYTKFCDYYSRNSLNKLENLEKLCEAKLNFNSQLKNNVNNEKSVSKLSFKSSIKSLLKTTGSFKNTNSSFKKNLKVDLENEYFVDCGDYNYDSGVIAEKTNSFASNQSSSIFNSSVNYSSLEKNLEKEKVHIDINKPNRKQKFDKFDKYSSSNSSNNIKLSFSTPKKNCGELIKLKTCKTSEHNNQSFHIETPQKNNDEFKIKLKNCENYIESHRRYSQFTLSSSGNEEYYDF